MLQRCASILEERHPENVEMGSFWLIVIVHPLTPPSLSKGLVNHDSLSSHTVKCVQRGWLIITVHPVSPPGLYRGLVNHDNASSHTTKSVQRVG